MRQPLSNRRHALVWPVSLMLTALLLPVAAPAQRHVPGDNPELPRVKYADSLTSANDRCMVAGSKLNPKVRPVYVNGVPMGFC